MWGHELNSRHEMEKMTVKGKMESATYTQTKGYLKPLLKLLRRNQLNDDIRDSLSSMLRYVQPGFANSLPLVNFYMEKCIYSRNCPQGLKKYRHLKLSMYGVHFYTLLIGST